MANRSGEERGVERLALPERFRTSVRTEDHPSQESTVVVGVSGRSDSVALLHLLREVAPERGLRLVVAHVQHGTAPETRGDAESVQQLAASLRLPIDLYLDEHPADDPAGRAAERQRYFSHVRERTGAAAIALGETADDLAVRLLDRLLDGNLQQSSEQDGLWRPLAPFTHADCVAYLQASGLSYRRAPAALALNSPAERLRLLILPFLQRHVRTNALPALARAAETLAADAQFLRDLAQAARSEVLWTEQAGTVSVDHQRWAALPTALRLRLLADAVRATARNGERGTGNQDLASLDALCRSLTTDGARPHGALNITLADGILTFGSRVMSHGSGALEKMTHDP